MTEKVTGRVKLGFNSDKNTVKRLSKIEELRKKFEMGEKQVDKVRDSSNNKSEVMKIVEDIDKQLKSGVSGGSRRTSQKQVRGGVGIRGGVSELGGTSSMQANVGLET